MRGFFSFDEYFNADRDRYYRNLQMELPIDFYEGRHDPDHTPWVEYFVETMTKNSGSRVRKITIIKSYLLLFLPPIFLSRLLLLFPLCLCL
jgi:hypothetical protein